MSSPGKQVVHTNPICPPPPSIPNNRVYLSAKVFANVLTGEPIDIEAITDRHGAGQHVVNCKLLTELTPDGTAVLEDGSRLPDIDTIIFCTGAMAHAAAVRFLLWGGTQAWRGPSGTNLERP